jgi:molybdate transport system substrate-binding protein
MRRMARLAIFTLLALAISLLSACAGQTGSSPTTAQQTTLTVYAAASLTDAFKEIGANFQRSHANVTVVFNFAGSQQLEQQLAQGATADVFASANTSYMDAAIKAGVIAGETQKTFVRNRLITIVPKDNPAHIQTLQDLGKPGVKIVLADKSVPVGQYALTFLDKASADPAFGAAYKANVLKNVASYEDNVKSVFSKVQLGEADAGIVYTSDVSTHGDEVGSLGIPDALNTIAVYPIAALKVSHNASTAQQFVAYVLSTEGQAVLKKYGFVEASAG